MKSEQKKESESVDSISNVENISSKCSSNNSKISSQSGKTRDMEKCLDKIEQTSSLVLNIDDFLKDVVIDKQKNTDSESILNIPDVDQEIIQIPNDYIISFEKSAFEQKIMVGKIRSRDLEAKRRKIEKTKTQYFDQEAEITRKNKLQLYMDEKLAKDRFKKFYKMKMKSLNSYEKHIIKTEKESVDNIRNEFIRSEHQLIQCLENRKGFVKTYYGDLQIPATLTSAKLFISNFLRRYRVDWKNSPQPVEIKLVSLRGLRDKSPAGEYILTCSIYDRLGGEKLRWSNLKGQLWHTSSKFNDTLFTVLPSKNELNPTTVLIFELWLLKGNILPNDRVIGWSCFPVCDHFFNIVHGKYKCLFLRGCYDARIDKYSTCFNKISQDLDHWLCNFYIDIKKLPRYMIGHKEFEMEISITSPLLGYPYRRVIDTHNSDKEDYYKNKNDTKQNFNENINDYKINQSYNEEEEKTITNLNQFNRNFSTIISYENDYKNYDHENNDSTTRKIRMLALQEENTMREVENYPGMYYKKYYKEYESHTNKKLYSILPSDSSKIQDTLEKANFINNWSNDEDEFKKVKLEELEMHKFSVKECIEETVEHRKLNWNRLKYIQNVALGEFGFRNWSTVEFWQNIFFLIAIFFLKSYIHYTFQWLFLQFLEIPINKFELLIGSGILNYQQSILSPINLIFFILVGPMSILMVFLILVGFSVLLQVIAGFIPNIGSKFILIFGFHAFFDPLTICIDDLARLRFYRIPTQHIADCVKLYWYYEISENAGIYGIVLILLLYALFMFLSLTLLYIYFLRLHNNGRLIDLYQRLNCSNDMFCVPNDTEISINQLQTIIRESDNWRGEDGDRRKVIIIDYYWKYENESEDATNENDSIAVNEEITTHVSIYTIRMDGHRDLYRQFLRSPDGAISEPPKEENVRNQRIFSRISQDLGTTSLSKLKQKKSEILTPIQENSTNKNFKKIEPENRYVERESSESIQDSNSTIISILEDSETKSLRKRSKNI
ncbi:hypothetical protein A3Q56_04028 [Intoshia linei]|uniref:Uncharacterized protein n=1 Tax=Intoshia linei TaxID=1819745 RepID=A0A177B1X0_9BILA|nr:hypothetical protein A3Q56_04028 [Intoshia linei]